MEEREAVNEHMEVLSAYVSFKSASRYDFVLAQVLCLTMAVTRPKFL